MKLIDRYEFVSANCVDCGSGVDEGVCLDLSHEDNYEPIYCMSHGQTYDEHEVGKLCSECGKQWFFSPDWSTPECRAMMDREAVWRNMNFYQKVVHICRNLVR